MQCKTKAVVKREALSKLMKPAIEAKDAPATCWYLGEVRGFAFAARREKYDEPC